MIFMNETETIGRVITNGTLGITGELVATMFIIFIILIVIAFMFQIPLEFTAVLLLPFCISVGAYYSNFMAPLIVILIYLCTIMAKNWLFR